LKTWQKTQVLPLIQFFQKLLSIISALQDKLSWKYSGRGKFMPLPLKNKILETPGSLVTDDIKMFPL
jgi:hypothetical protein